MDGFKKESDTFDLIIRNGLLVDGTGNKSQKADIAVKDGLFLSRSSLW